VSKDDDDAPKRKRLSITEMPPSENEMYRVRRKEVVLDPKGASETDLQEFDNHLHDSGSADMPFELDLALYLEAIEENLDKLGFPPPRGWYLVKDDNWGAFPEDWNLATAAEYGTMVEVLDPKAPHRIETGANYIKRRADALSRPWWLGRLGELIIRILDEPDPDRQLTLTLLLGEERQRFLNQEGFLPVVHHGSQFSHKQLDRANQQRKRDGHRRERNLIAEARSQLEKGRGRFSSNGEINFSRAVSTQVESIGDSQGVRFLIHTDHR